MADKPADSDISPSEGGMAQIDPQAADRFQNADTRSMIHELVASIGALQQSVTSIDGRLERDSRRMDGFARDQQAINDRFAEMSPKLDGIAGFITHGVPHLATKADIESVKSEISHRPTRRQSIEDVLKFGGLKGAIVAVFGLVTRAH